MFCPKCGNQVSDTATFCNKCGAQVQARQVQQTVENQNTNETRLKPEEGAAVQNQAQVVSNAVSKPSISGGRIAAIVITMIAICTSFMPWYEPGYALSYIVNNISSFLGLLSSGSVSIPTLEESYNIWMTPDLVNTVSTLLEYAGKSSSKLPYLYLTFALFILGIVLAVVGVVKTYKRNGGKAALVLANLVFLSASLAYYFGHSNYFYPGNYAVLSLCCLVISIIGVIVSGASKNPEST